jgi:lysozyme family protein
VIRVEREYWGEPGDVKREAAIDAIAGMINIPMIPDIIETPIKRAAIGYLVDLAVEKLNWLTGYSFKNAEISPEAQSQLAAVVDAPITLAAKSIAFTPVSQDSGVSVDDRIKALYEKYGIEATVSKSETVEEAPQQETIHAEAETPAPALEPVETQWDRILSFILRWEGEYSNDPDDPGGETNMGITAATLAAAYGSGLVKNSDIKKLTREDASRIYEVRFYKNYGYEKLPFAVSLAVTDMTVNHGRGGAARIVQRACNRLGKSLTVDGKWGPKTQAAVELLAREVPGEFVRLLLDERKKYYDGIIADKPSQMKFRKGWYNRLKALAAVAGAQSPV